MSGEQYLVEGEEKVYSPIGNMIFTDKRLIVFFKNSFKDIYYDHISSTELRRIRHIWLLIAAAIPIFFGFLAIIDGEIKFSVVLWLIGAVLIILFYVTGKRVFRIVTEQEKPVYVFKGAEAAEVVLKASKIIREYKK